MRLPKHRSTAGSSVDLGSRARMWSALADERSGRLVFVSHCLLNQNTRYAGGAFRPGAVAEVIEPLLGDGVGICQMRCPEQVAWGGVAKRYLMHWWGRPHARPLAKLALSPFLLYTRLRYRVLARRVAAEIVDYRANGAEVVGVIGVGASPSCGVGTTIDVAAMLRPVVGCPPECLDRNLVNDAIEGAVRPGPGIFIEELTGALARRRVEVPFLEHDLRSESPVSQLPSRTTASR